MLVGVGANALTSRVSLMGHLPALALIFLVDTGFPHLPDKAVVGLSPERALRVQLTVPAHPLFSAPAERTPTP